MHALPGIEIAESVLSHTPYSLRRHSSASPGRRHVRAHMLQHVIIWPGTHSLLFWLSIPACRISDEKMTRSKRWLSAVKGVWGHSAVHVGWELLSLVCVWTTSNCGKAECHFTLVWIVRFQIQMRSCTKSDDNRTKWFGCFKTNTSKQKSVKVVLFIFHDCMIKTNKNKEKNLFPFRSVDVFWKVVGHYVIFRVLCVVY